MRAFGGGEFLAIGHTTALLLFWLQQRVTKHLRSADGALDFNCQKERVCTDPRAEVVAGL
jgi:hypothetical protein